MCGCGIPFCDPCFDKRSMRHKAHRRGGSRKTERFWAKVSGLHLNLSHFDLRAKCFKEDEFTKWFGLWTENSVTTIVETKRLPDLMKLSTTFSERSPQVNLEAPVPAASTGGSITQSTTGEVNLYLDPETFGTESPVPYADCEGMVGTEAIAAQHQKDSFSAVDKEIIRNTTIQEYASRLRVSTMRQLFEKSFSSVYVHYMPLQGYKTLGATDIMERQYSKLSKRLQLDSARVQHLRQKAWTRFDVRELSLVSRFAFEHLASGNHEPFDFDKCRKELSIPTSLEDHFASFFRHCLKDNMGQRLEATAAVLSSSILLSSYRTQGRSLLPHPNVILNGEMMAICSKAADAFLTIDSICGFVDSGPGEKCVNSQYGHAAGHQSNTGKLLGDGPFLACHFDRSRFIGTINTVLRTTMQLINAESPTNQESWRRLAAAKHRDHLANLRKLRGYPAWNYETGTTSNDFVGPKICFGCLYGKPEFLLPCSHIICADCLADFDTSSDEQRYPGNHVHESCSRPPLASYRVLSLDGGGVRGVVELTLLKRLERHIDLDVPLGRFFDLILGTSADKGGMISLGLGVQQRTASECINLFRTICEQGFESKPGTTVKYAGYFVRMLHSSMYKTEKFEEAVEQAFGPQPTALFGRSHSTRVAVTTTVDSNPKLIANYTMGGSDDYLESDLQLWEAARCTSAAPTYFKPMLHRSGECYDGGLRRNNPVQVALNQCTVLWGTGVDFDLILSVGSGDAKDPPHRPSANEVANRPKQWWKPLIATFFSTLNGEAAWKEYISGNRPSITQISCRLNVTFKDKEPALNAVGDVNHMERTAEEAKVSRERHIAQNKTPLFPMIPVCESYKDDLLLVLADEIRASMFFFQLDWVKDSQSHEIYSHTGWIGCQFWPHEKALRLLLGTVHYFEVEGTELQVPEVVSGKPFRLPLAFHKQVDQIPININANFGSNRTVPISVFPMGFEVRTTLLSRVVILLNMLIMQLRD
ncbi:hypothetical protein CSAL01_03198 [Colletotrichum salicis]|uniref:PNPLA domain-containing protein n=1 Tax=Colletotrichum salicis TaxID=1209931 RepID=A0A135U8Q4_9PEZI|nr:hypothetical protein CSAL01_03198 [Colletotrichum salicis]